MTVSLFFLCKSHFSEDDGYNTKKELIAYIRRTLDANHKQPGKYSNRFICERVVREFCDNSGVPINHWFDSFHEFLAWDGMKNVIAAVKTNGRSFICSRVCVPNSPYTCWLRIRRWSCQGHHGDILDARHHLARRIHQRARRRRFFESAKVD